MIRKTQLYTISRSVEKMANGCKKTTKMLTRWSEGGIIFLIKNCRRADQEPQKNGPNYRGDAQRS